MPPHETPMAGRSAGAVPGRAVIYCWCCQCCSLPQASSHPGARSRTLLWPSPGLCALPTTPPSERAPGLPGRGEDVLGPGVWHCGGVRRGGVPVLAARWHHGTGMRGSPDQPCSRCPAVGHSAALLGCGAQRSPRVQPRLPKPHSQPLGLRQRWPDPHLLPLSWTRLFRN